MKLIEIQRRKIAREWLFLSALQTVVYHAFKEVPAEMLKRCPFPFLSFLFQRSGETLKCFMSDLWR